MRTRSTIPSIRGPADVFGRMGPRLRDVAQEEFHALLLNTRHRGRAGGTRDPRHLGCLPRASPGGFLSGRG